jgi:hypothetical protein
MPNLNNRISGVIVSMLASSAVDRGFEPQLGQTKDYNIIQHSFSYKGYEIQFKLVSLYTDIDNDKNHIIFQL